MICAPDSVTSERLTGHRVGEDDIAYLLETDGDLRVQQWLYGKVQTPEQSRARMQRLLRMWTDDGFGFWIFRDQSSTNIGHAGLFRSPREPGEVEVGYVIKPAYWGRGFATEMTLLALRIGFEELRLERIIAIAQASNAPSRRVMEKCRMTFDAELASPDGVPGVRYALAASAYRAAC